METGPAAGPALYPLPAAPAGVGWPDPDWTEAAPPDGVLLDPLLDAAFDPVGVLAQTYAVVVVHRGVLVAERYGGTLAHFDRPEEPVGRSTALLSWSMAKSMLHAVVGVLVAEGRLSPFERAPVAAWAAPDDPRRAITLAHLLSMRDGLDFVEDYVDDRVSDVISMLFGPGQHDMAAFAADRPLAAAPGERFNYSSGATNIISGLVADMVGRGDAYRRFVEERLFAPLAMCSGRPGLDGAGTWVASSYVHATARDFAKFGLLYLRDGMAGGRRLLPEGWVDGARTPRSVDPSDGARYGWHWWVVDDGLGTFRAAGYEGQSITVCPAHDLVVVRLGKTPAERAGGLARWRGAMVASFAPLARPAGGTGAAGAQPPS